jgi:hypothetical protein
LQKYQTTFYSCIFLLLCAEETGLKDIVQILSCLMVAENTLCQLLEEITHVKKKNNVGQT